MASDNLVGAPRGRLIFYRPTPSRFPRSGSDSESENDNSQIQLPLAVMFERTLVKVAKKALEGDDERYYNR